jgi:hypothetical protein
MAPTRAGTLPAAPAAITFAWVAEAVRAIPAAHFAAAVVFGVVWGLANALGWMLGSGSPDPWKMAAHFVYDSLLPMLLLAVGLGLADARTIGQPQRVAPYAVAAILAAVFGQLLFNVTSPLLGLRQCGCTMDDWPVGGHTANMLPDSLLICAFVTAGYVYRRRAALRVAHLHAARLERAQLMRQTLESRLQAMQACIEPEFLFDTLAEVERMHATDPATAVRLLDELIVYLRAALPHLRESTSVVAKECELAYAYLNIHKMRRADALSFAFEIGADAQDASMPPMLLLPLLDHALRDEFAAAGAPPSLRVAVRRLGDTLRIVMSAGSEAFRPGKAGSDVIARIRDRLRALYGTAARMELGADGDRASTLILDIPHESAHGSSR